MKYKFTKKLEKELGPMLERGLHPSSIAQYLGARRGGYLKALTEAVSALGSLYSPIKEDNQQ